MKLEVYDDAGGKARWRLKATNGQTVAASGEAFASRSSARRAAANFKAKADGWRYEVYADKGKKYRWRAISPANGQNVASGGESFASESSAKRAATNIAKKAGAATGP
jgi:uncharacterized protein